jgi:ABC-type enterochelin transport system permease subunit
MKPLTIIGIVLIVLGIASFFIGIPRSDTQGVKFGDASIGVTTRTTQRAPLALSIVLIVAGAGLAVAGNRRG